MEKETELSYATKMKGKKGVIRIIKALGYSIDGLRAAYTEAGFRQLLIIHFVLFLIILFYIQSIAIKMILLFASFFSLIVELFNTAIEAAVDHTSEYQHPLAKRAKDVGSAAQYLSLIMCAILWIMAIVTHQ